MKFIILLISGIVLSTFAYATMPVNRISPEVGYQNEVKPALDLKIFPNPITGSKFSVTAGKEIISVELVNIVGQKSEVELKIKSAGSAEVILKNRKQGVYLVTVKFTDESKEVRRVVIN